MPTRLILPLPVSRPNTLPAALVACCFGSAHLLAAVAPRPTPVPEPVRAAESPPASAQPPLLPRDLPQPVLATSRRVPVRSHRGCPTSARPLLARSRPVSLRYLVPFAPTLWIWRSIA